MFACSLCTDDQSEIRDSSSHRPSGYAGMLSCEVNTWSTCCCAVKKASPVLYCKDR